MKRIDKLIATELLGPWLFGVGIFTVLIFAGTYLLRFTEYMTLGIEIGTVVKLTILTLPSVMSKTFSMAMLLAALLAFGRLSSDSEVVALRAAGASIGRIMLPVAGFGLCVAALNFWFDEQVVPFATAQAGILESDLKSMARTATAGATAVTVQDRDRLLLIAATEVIVSTQTMLNAQITILKPEGLKKKIVPTATLYANKLVYRDRRNWKIEGGGRIVTPNGVTQIEGDVWPTDIPNPDISIQDLLASKLKNADTMNMSEFATQIARLKRSPHPDTKQIANFEYMYYNKISVPLAALVFALVGAPLGIRHHRTGAATGFWLSVVIIFGYTMLANFMAVYAQGGKLPPYLASFTPLVIGLLFAIVTIHRKN